MIRTCQPLNLIDGTGAELFETLHPHYSFGATTVSPAVKVP